MIITLSLIFKGGSSANVGLSFFALFFLISAVCAFQSLCNSCTDVVMLPCLMMVFPGLSLFHNRLLYSLPKCNRNSECLFDALGKVL